MPARNFDNKTSSRPVSSPATTPEVVIPNVDSADGSVVVGEVGENSDSPVLRGKEEDSSNHGRPISEDTSTTAVHFSTNCNNESSSDNRPIAKGTVVASYNVRRAPRFVRRTQPSESQGLVQLQLDESDSKLHLDEFDSKLCLIILLQYHDLLHQSLINHQFQFHQKMKSAHDA
ncbi:uncharacterized protein MELLADRAFT_110201 [Melampsora larici-populina 98AG31]|uniref:Uncharacterized protein n=1 Tax=Melampsora larici-populina (strain 98AG31 / pathotype 3-4-7) TaxID=747676 RepID=F4RZ01_MELLP|nr:uncharacterized protein MELLADRAFT_110201 [Melampsora larici-populina 98AG31]EGG02413.1 hypothetical protein MELLADRAFT_110201 [Melampsora larici-populina 98AG31]